MLRSWSPEKRPVGGGLTTLPVKNIVSKTPTKRIHPFHILGDRGASAIPELMKDGRQSRKDPASLSTPPSNKASLRIASWNVRTMYVAGASTQIAKEMQRYRLHILGVSETHWI